LKGIEKMKHLQSRFLLIFLSCVLLVSASGCGTPSALSLTPSEISATPLPTIVSIPPTSLPLSGEWHFAADQKKDGEKQGWAEPAFDDSAWETVTVPHTWNVMKAYWDFNGIAWYRRSFTIPAESKDAHLRLRFEAVFYLARVWMNGQYIGQHEGGYTPFEFDVSAIAKPGVQNVVAVQVDNMRAADRIPAIHSSDWSFDWWNYGGIIRDVSLETTSRAYISQQKVVSTPHITGMDEADSATISATVSVKNTSGEALDTMLHATLLDNVSGQPVLTAPVMSSVSVPAGGSSNVEITATLGSPKLWHFDHPNLYRWSVTLLMADGQTLDTDEVKIGIRSIELKNGRFYLNGEPVRLAGVNRHAEYPGQGSAETVTAMVADYNDLKALNEVFTRPVHYPQAKTILDYADERGILLIPEVPAWQLSQEQMSDEKMRTLAKQQLSEMVAEDFNHPSVWAWSVANEIESNTFPGNAFVKEMIAHVKSLDPSRPVGFASDRLYWNPQLDATALSDFVAMNAYYGSWGGPKQGLGPALDAIHKTWPDKTVIISEFGFEPHWNARWGPATSTLNADQYFFVPDGTPSNSEIADAQRQLVIHEQMEVFRSKPFVAGSVFWSYQDYRTPSDFQTGLVAADRTKRGSWEVLRREYAPALIDSVTLSSPVDGKRTTTVALHTRGPVEVDMPAYTLRGYSIHWVLTSPDGATKFSEGNVALPTLAPAATWSGDVQWAVPAQGYVLTVSIIRPTGFTVIERTYDASGKLIP
jgi:beta-glucuronidase